MPEQPNPVQRFQTPSFPDREPIPEQSIEVKSRIQEYNRRAGVMPVFEEEVKMPAGFIDRLMDSGHKDSFEAWNLLRRGRQNIISITVDRKEGIVVEQARSSNDVKRAEGQCKTLLYGNKQEAEQAWMGIDRNVMGIKVDVRQPYVTTVKGATD